MSIHSKAAKKNNAVATTPAVVVDEYQQMMESKRQKKQSVKSTAPAKPCAAPFYKRKAFWGAAAGVGVVVGTVIAVRTGHLNLDMFNKGQ